MSEAVVVFNGKTYKRNAKSKYYFEATTRNKDRRNAQQLHRAVWEHYNGAIPEGWHVHHIDGDIDNNDISNLACMPASEHLSLHARQSRKSAVYVERQKEALKVAREKAKEWHKSEAGHEWHKKHVAESIAKSYSKKVDCVCGFCGKEFKGHPSSKYCSQSCGEKAWRRKKYDVFMPEKRLCVICGGEYTAMKKNAKYCSPKCK